jgi:hypothetical protein
MREMKKVLKGIVLINKDASKNAYWLKSLKTLFHRLN